MTSPVKEIYVSVDIEKYSFSVADQTRFWSRVSRSSNDVCWPWTGRLKKGYGCFDAQNRGFYAHRLAFELGTETLLGELSACHRCDNPSCCNPGHLFSGTQGDNNRDRHNKGRSAPIQLPSLSQRSRGDSHYARTRPDALVRGDDHSQSVLTSERVRALRLDRDSGSTITDLAKKYGVSRTTAHRAATGKSWSHV